LAAVQTLDAAPCGAVADRSVRSTMRVLQALDAAAAPVAGWIFRLSAIGVAQALYA
jgi:hypothetical protein